MLNCHSMYNNIHTFAFLIFDIATFHSPVPLLHIGSFDFELAIIYRQRSIRHADSRFVTITVNHKHRF